MFPFSTATVSALCSELDEWRDRLDRTGPLPRRWSGRLRRDLEAEAVAGSLGIEQIPVTVDEVRQILAGALPRTVSDHDRKLIEGYRDAMGFVLRRADDDAFSWNADLILGLHDRILGASYAEGAGRFATAPRWLHDHKTNTEIFAPPPHAQVPQLVAEACNYVNGSKEHPAVIAAWIHIAIAAIHPFRDGNGRTSRVLASLAMYRGSFQRREFTSLEEWWGRHVEDYRNAFQCLGPRFHPESDITPFIERHVGAQLSQVKALDLRERVERRIWTALENIVTDRTLDPRVTHAVWDAFYQRDVTAGYYIGVTEVSTATATKDLAAATAAQLLNARGERRGRRYLAGPELLTLLARELNIYDLPDDLASARGHIGHVLASALTRYHGRE